MSPSPSRPDKPTHKVTFLVNNRPVHLEDSSLTGAQIKQAAELPADFKLYDSNGDEIGDEQVIEIKSGTHFTAISGQDVS